MGQDFDVESEDKETDLAGAVATFQSALDEFSFVEQETKGPNVAEFAAKTADRSFIVQVCHREGFEQRVLAFSCDGGRMTCVNGTLCLGPLDDLLEQGVGALRDLSVCSSFLTYICPTLIFFFTSDLDLAGNGMKDWLRQIGSSQAQCLLSPRQLFSGYLTQDRYFERKHRLGLRGWEEVPSSQSYHSSERREEFVPIACVNAE